MKVILYFLMNMDWINNFQTLLHIIIYKINYNQNFIQKVFLNIKIVFISGN